MRLTVLALGALCLATSATAQTPEQTAEAALKATPVWDGHNDLPEQLRSEPWLVQGTYQRGIGNQLTLYGGSALSDGYLSLLYGVGLSTPVGAFAADVTHELKNPIASVRSAIEGLGRVKNDEQRAQLLAIADEDVRRLDRLVNDISEASRVDAQLSRTLFEPIDVGMMIESMLAARTARQRLHLVIVDDAGGDAEDDQQDHQILHADRPNKTSSTNRDPTYPSNNSTLPV